MGKQGSRTWFYPLYEVVSNSDSALTTSPLVKMPSAPHPQRPLRSQVFSRFVFTGLVCESTRRWPGAQ